MPPGRRQDPPLGNPNDPRGFEVLIRRYLESLEVRGYSESTQRNGRSYLRSFARFCLERGVQRPAEVTRPLVERYQRFLFHYRKDNGKPLGAVTQYGMLQRLKAFFAWLAKERYLVYTPPPSSSCPSCRHASPSTVSPSRRSSRSSTHPTSRTWSACATALSSRPSTPPASAAKRPSPSTSTTSTSSVASWWCVRARAARAGSYRSVSGRCAG